jgi:hypothetical protein
MAPTSSRSTLTFMVAAEDIVWTGSTLENVDRLEGNSKTVFDIGNREHLAVLAGGRRKGSHDTPRHFRFEFDLLYIPTIVATQQHQKMLKACNIQVCNPFKRQLWIAVDGKLEVREACHFCVNVV